MTDRPSDHWNNLASSLGATPTEESPQPLAEPPQVEAAEPDFPRKAATETAALPARPAPPRPKPAAQSDWGSLASELGIELPPENVKPTPVEPSSAEQAGPAATSREEAPFGLVAESTSSTPTIEDIWPDLAEPSPTETGSSAPGTTQVDTEFAAGLAAELDAVAGNVASAPLGLAHDGVTAEESGTEPPRKKSRRRRRRRKPRSEEQATEAATARDSDPDADDAEDQERTSRRRPRRRKRRPDTDEPTDREGDESVFADRDPDDDTDDEPSRGGRTKKAGHKQIPTWEEAIGIIVENNLSSRSRRGGGGSRGRGRRSSGSRRK